MAENRFEPLGLGAGTLINGRYDVTRKLGAGGMSAVFQVVDRALSNDVIALKLFEPRLTDDKTLLDRFRNEVLITRKLTHPNIVRTYDFGEAEKRYYFMTMEYIRGVTLEKLIESQLQGGLSFNEALKILSEILKGVAAAHKMGVIHRDLKPANVLISESGEVKITDFGLARTFEITQRFTQAGECVGTPYYMAPEQIQEQETDERVDLYAIGIIAYELVTGEVPFAEKSWFNLANKIIKEPLPDLAEKVRKIPEWYTEFVKKATAKEKENRFRSADEMLQAIADCMETDFEHTDLCLPTRNRQTSHQRVRDTIFPIAERQLYSSSVNYFALFYRVAPLVLIISLLALAGIAVVSFGSKQVDQFSVDVQQNTAGVANMINNFQSTLEKLHNTVVKIHEDKDKIDQFLEHESNATPTGLPAERQN